MKNNIIKHYATVFCIFIYTFFLSSCGNDDIDNSQGTATISGHLQEDGEPASGVDMYFEDVSSTVWSVKTDNNGSYSALLAPGNYKVKPVEIYRVFSPEIQNVELTLEGLANIDFTRDPFTYIIHNGAKWEFYNSNVFSFHRNNTRTLQIDLAQNALWYNESEGGAIYQTISGDFSIEANVDAVKKQDSTASVTCEICLGGIMVRNPDISNGQNYVHLVTGFTPEGLGYESKNTINSVSEFTATSDGKSRHDLRITRTGQSFTLYKKTSGETEWQQVTVYKRDDLPTTLQVGLNIYTAQSGSVADLSVIYKNITIIR